MDLSFRELTNLYANPQLYSIRIGSEVIRFDDEDIKIYRSNRYIEILNSKYIITIAMTVNHLKRCKEIEKRLARSTTSLFTPYQVTRRRVLATSHDDIFADVVIQELPVGAFLSSYLECASCEEVQEVYGAIQYLEESLLALDGAFSTLSPDDIIIGNDGLLYPFRYHTLHFKRGVGEVSGCESLLESISHGTSLMTIMPSETYSHREHYAGHLATDMLHEDRVVVEDPTGVGYVDSSNREVIPSIYLSADSFSEGRAMVESYDGFGLINTDGELLLSTIYESLGYNPDTGITSARKDGKWAYFSYCGEQLTEFTDEYPNEDITLEQILRMRQSHCRPLTL